MYMPYIYRYTLFFLVQPNLARNWLKLGIAANKTSAKQFKFEFKLAAPLAGCLAACCHICNMPLPQRAPAPFRAPPPPCPAAWPLLMPSNDIEGPITRCDAVWRCCCCCDSFFHFLATSWMPANCFLCSPPPANPFPARTFSLFAWMRPLCLFVCSGSGNGSSSEKKTFFY